MHRRWLTCAPLPGVMLVCSLHSVLFTLCKLCSVQRSFSMNALKMFDVCPITRCDAGVQFALCTVSCATMYTLHKKHHFDYSTDAPMVDVCPITRCDAGVQSRHQAISQAAGIFTAATIIISQSPPIVIPVIKIIIPQSPQIIILTLSQSPPTIIYVAVIINLNIFQILIAEKPL